MADDLHAQARQALDRGDPDAARDLLAKAHAASPDDAEIRELYAGLLLAHAIHLATDARDARRRDIARRKIPYDEEFQDSPEVARAFDAALAAHDAVLAVETGHEKALMMKATLLFRRDRATGREAALAILRGLEAAHPDHKQVTFLLKKVGTPCPRCTDTGFCPYCAGRGVRTILRFERVCEKCHSDGICPVCGVL